LVLRTTPLLEQLRIVNNINVQTPSKQGVQPYGRQQVAARSSVYRLQLQAMLDAQSELPLQLSTNILLSTLTTL